MDTKGKMMITLRRPIQFRALVAAVLCFWGGNLGAQAGMSFSEAAAAGIRTSQLDSIYRPAVGADSTQVVFGLNQEKFVEAYQLMLRDLGSYLKKNGFRWEREVRSFTRIYFDPSGHVDHFLFNFRPGELAPEKEAEFKALLNSFLEGYKFPLSAAEPFVQCSPVRFRDR